MAEPHNAAFQVKYRVISLYTLPPVPVNRRAAIRGNVRVPDIIQ
jgi:hypothetical protein